MSRSIFVVAALFFAQVSLAKSVVVFSGGFGSCYFSGDTSELKAAPQMDQLVESITKSVGRAPAEVRSCYAFGSDEIFVTSEVLGIYSESMTRAEFHNVIDRTVQKVAGGLPTKSVGVYLWGQSHGGWTAMDFARRKSDLNIRLLMTVDAISVLNCGPWEFSGGVITGYAKGCTEAPSDMTSSGPTIASHVKSWVNWYQTQYPHLHSDKIAAATENFLKYYEDDFWHLAGAHSMIEVDESIWSVATQRVIADIKSTGL